jgi:hypothetical protein
LPLLVIASAISGLFFFAVATPWGIEEREKHLIYLPEVFLRIIGLEHHLFAKIKTPLQRTACCP